MLGTGKYQTYQISSNVTYATRLYTQNFLTYSPLDDVLVFIEPKHQIHVYDGKSLQLIMTIPMSNVLIGASAISLFSRDHHELYFIYEYSVTSKFIALRLCQVHFNRLTMKFENRTCIDTLKIYKAKSNFRINGFAIKRNHAEKNRSFIFLSTSMGLIHAVFNTQTGVFTRAPITMNDTSSDGSIVVSSKGAVYYAAKQEDTIYELLIGNDFRVRYGKIIKSNGIKNPYGLIIDECDHL